MPTSLSPSARFIADLHLSESTPGKLELLRHFLADTARGGAEVFILGDLMDYWVGDDDLERPFPAQVAATLAGAGTAIRFLAGNRDFLIGPRFAQAAGLALLDDPSVVDLQGTPTLLAHGDLFCIDDLGYQALRRHLRDPAWQAAFLALPLEERHRQAAHLRADSVSAKAEKTVAEMDVNLEAARQAMDTAGCARLIHGHIHRRGRHLDGARERYCLPSWDDAPGYLLCDGEGCRFLDL